MMIFVLFILVKFGINAYTWFETKVPLFEVYKLCDMP